MKENTNNFTSVFMMYEYFIQQILNMFRVMLFYNTKLQIRLIVSPSRKCPKPTTNITFTHG